LNDDSQRRQRQQQLEEQQRKQRELQRRLDEQQRRQRQQEMKAKRQRAELCWAARARDSAATTRWINACGSLSALQDKQAADRELSAYSS